MSASSNAIISNTSKRPNTVKKALIRTSQVALVGMAAFSLMACATNHDLDATAHDAQLQPVNVLSITKASALRVATWNVEHLAYPIDTGCKPRTKDEIDAMRAYIERVDADIYALQEVGSERAVRMLFPQDQWQVFMSPRQDSEPYTCRRSGRTSTQQKLAYAVRNELGVNSIQGIDAFGLDMPGLRYGLEMNVSTAFGDISILNVHMKSGCFVDNYSRSDREDCAVFAKQTPVLDGWIEGKERENSPYLLLGDFNHRLSAPYNHLTQQLFTNTDGSASSLVNTTADLIGCHPYYPAPIDLVFVGEMPVSALTFKSQAHDFDNMEVDEMLSDHCAVSLDISSSIKPLSNAVKWQTSSKEYRFLTRAVYQQAQMMIEQGSTPADNWVVVMDVDETILDNSPYQVILDENGLSYSPDTWAQWVKDESAELVPGAQSFMQSVLDNGGKLALITNRDKSLDAHTWANLTALGLPINAENTCLLGRSQADKSAMDGLSIYQDKIINDKDLRRQQVQAGRADCYREDGNPISAAWRINQQIIMEVGDNIEDFSGITQEDADPDELVQQWPSRFILLPNPMYGSW
ncbi:HAD family acid phosphatase [Ningiella sp. W23]|uniref:HAD family acid phosphatase n=1 Tax=Ningiella sp. W23 TaxID=3023715 RepID=UPI00375682DD